MDEGYNRAPKAQGKRFFGKSVYSKLPMYTEALRKPFVYQRQGTCSEKAQEDPKKIPRFWLIPRLSEGQKLRMRPELSIEGIFQHNANLSVKTAKGFFFLCFEWFSLSLFPSLFSTLSFVSSHSRKSLSNTSSTQTERTDTSETTHERKIHFTK